MQTSSWWEPDRPAWHWRAGCGQRASTVRVLDGAAGPAVTSRALGLQPRGVEVLDRLGALGDLPTAAYRSTGLSSTSTAVNWRSLRSGCPCTAAVVPDGPASCRRPTSRQRCATG